jgi:hypothetical protein
MKLLQVLMTEANPQNARDDRRKRDADFMLMIHGAMTRDAYNKKWKLGKYRVKKSPLAEAKDVTHVTISKAPDVVKVAQAALKNKLVASWMKELHLNDGQTCLYKDANGAELPGLLFKQTVYDEHLDEANKNLADTPFRFFSFLHGVVLGQVAPIKESLNEAMHVAGTFSIVLDTTGGKVEPHVYIVEASWESIQAALSMAATGAMNRRDTDDSKKKAIELVKNRFKVLTCSEAKKVFQGDVHAPRVVSLNEFQSFVKKEVK